MKHPVGIGDATSVTGSGVIGSILGSYAGFRIEKKSVGTKRKMLLSFPVCIFLASVPLAPEAQ